ncbi:hypothetical protein CONPUDRAFT_115432 [Coniophora puteana RWD-64-598 SS2]|uniref:T6SS Phospholipase effector Tle1-like catalytic domain-containing protein n=1 Tax=Coniophora puteana (strain RWD-64-598) TaxID=741705 RepID=A0A5M3N7D3_CONPW|nr:uncharacterized protein CONPUDRAFT_115432 [Coniophora puteana RWD-64-598 SS2]EIW86761.1 hypothetical protein CONPUDRAFT_115432 [Coniophora puteana RWD-64-598 SS2]
MTSPPLRQSFSAQADHSAVKKRIVVCCDGTWQDGIVMKERWMYTNILKLSRAIEHTDPRVQPPIPQVVFYQSGVGSAQNLYSEYYIGATGASLAEKVQEAYAFISQNFHPGDEVFLFGFSRGAYTARMVAMFIGAIGILDRTDMDHFAEIFVNYQKLGKAQDPAEKAALQTKLARWTSPESSGKKRADADRDTFSVKCVGVFDTVGSVGLPEEITRKSPPAKSIFGFPNTELGDHIERAYQALAINETREDFNCAKFNQSEAGRVRGQVLKQVWFTGSHSDIGGGWQDHDLSDLTLTWMAASIGDILALNFKYLASLPDPVAPWGQQPPHDPRTGIFAFSEEINRELPQHTDNKTHEYFHPSVKEQVHLRPSLAEMIKSGTAPFCELLPLELEVKQKWAYVPDKHDQKHSQGEKQVQSASSSTAGHIWSTAKNLVSLGSILGQEVLQEVQYKVSGEDGGPSSSSVPGWLSSVAHESHMGSVVKELTKGHSESK